MADSILLRESLKAMERLIEWDKSRKFIVPYKVRDPIHAAIKGLRSVPTELAWEMPSNAELFKFINETPLLGSLLYDINLLPECITDPVRWTYMVTVCNHMKAALAATPEVPHV